MTGSERTPAGDLLQAAQRRARLEATPDEPDRPTPTELAQEQADTEPARERDDDRQ